MVLVVSEETTTVHLSATRILLVNQKSLQLTAHLSFYYALVNLL
jgi:hypothetical protein